MLSLKEQHERCLYPEVRVRAQRALGSGTVIFSEPTPGEDGMFDAYVLTNAHVVDDLIDVVKKWDNVLRREVKIDVLGHPIIEVFQFAYMSRVHGTASYQADIVAYDKEEDLALVRVRSTQEFKYIATMIPRDEINKLVSFMPVWNVGCGLGGPPAITEGYLSAFGVDIERHDYMLVTAPSIFGNSGGGTFLQETGTYIGIPARISVAWMAAVTHLGFSITPERIYQFLEDQIFEFIYDSTRTSTQCADDRSAKRKADRWQRSGEPEPLPEMASMGTHEHRQHEDRSDSSDLFKGWDDDELPF